MGFFSGIYLKQRIMPTYYVSQNGNDSSNGLSPSTAWKTIDRVNQLKYSLQPGDQILFERNGTYQGNLIIGSSGSAAQPIVVSSYGAGALPKLTGARKVSSWTLHNGNIWKAIVTEEVKYLFQNDEMLRVARWPNEGYMTNDFGTDMQIYDAALTQPDGYFNGATITVRNTAWSYNNVICKEYKGKTLYFDKSMEGYGVGDMAWGYYLSNKIEFLDTEGEWYFDKSNNTLYLWPKGNVNPNTISIEAATKKPSDFAVSITYNRQYVHVSDLRMCYYTERAFDIQGPNNKLERCEIDHSYCGINVYGDKNIIRDNDIHDVYGTGVFVTYGESNVIEDNHLMNIATVPGLGENAWGYIGLRMSGNKTVVRGNILDKIGYIGITVEKDHLCEKNMVSNACYILNDGAGIAFDHADGLVIRNNIVVDTIGNIDGVPPTWEGAKPKGKGIYFGNTRLNNITVMDNTVTRCNGAGIWVDHVKTSSGNTIAGNTLFNNELYQLGMSDWSNNMSAPVNGSHAVPAYNDVVKDNIAYCMKPDQSSMFQIHGHYHDVDFGTFSNNVLYNPFKADSIKVEYITPVHSFSTFTLAQWQAATGDDMNSTATGGTSTKAEDHILIYNDQMSDQAMPLPVGTWSDVKNTLYNGSVTLAPFTSKILFRTTAVSIPTITSVIVTADRNSVNENAAALLMSTVQGTGAFNNSVTWTIVSGGGTLSSASGAQVTYTAPAVTTDSTAVIKATSVADPTKSGTVQITVKNVPAPTITSVVVSANPVIVNEKMTSQLTAVVNGTGAFNNAVTWRLLSGGVGRLSSNTGQTITYTAPSVSSDKTTRIRATSVANTGKYGTVTLTIKNVVTPTITSVSVGASPAIVSAGETSTLNATVQGVGAFDSSVTWSITSGGGTLSSTSGAHVTFTAPSVISQQSIVIKASSVADASKSGTVTIVVNPIVGVVNSVTVVPSAPTMNEGSSTSLSANIQGTGPYGTGVSWSIVTGGGSLSSTATNPTVYTAPFVSANSTAVVRATSTFDTSKFNQSTIAINNMSIVNGLNIQPHEMGVVINADDPTSQAIANEYITRWNIPAANVKTVNLGNVDSVPTNIAASVRQTLNNTMPSAVQWLALCFNRPSRVNNDNSITWAMTVGYNTISRNSNLPENPLLGYAGNKPFADKGIRPSMLVTSIALVQKARASHAKKPTGTCYMLAANDQGGQPRGRSRIAQMTGLNGSSAYSGITFNYADNLNGPSGENAANNILNKSDMLFYFNGMYAIYGMETNAVRAGAVGDYVTSTSGYLPDGAGQTPISYMINNGFVGTMGTVIEPWQNTGPAGMSPGGLVEQFTNIQTFIPLYHGGRSLIDAYWKSVKWPTRSLFVGDPMVAPWGNEVSGVAPVMGCTDPAATNYNSNATINDGTCIYPPSAVKWATSFDGSGPSLMATTGANISPSMAWSNGLFANGAITTNANTSYPWAFGTISKIVLKGVTFLSTDSFFYTRINSNLVIKPDASVTFLLNGSDYPTGVVLVKGQRYESLEIIIPTAGINAITTILGGPLSTGSSCQMTLEGMEIYG